MRRSNTNTTLPHLWTAETVKKIMALTRGSQTTASCGNLSRGERFPWRRPSPTPRSTRGPAHSSPVRRGRRTAAGRQINPQLNTRDALRLGRPAGVKAYRRRPGPPPAGLRRDTCSAQQAKERASGAPSATAARQRAGKRERPAERRRHRQRGHEEGDGQRGVGRSPPAPKTFSRCVRSAKMAPSRVRRGNRRRQARLQEAGPGRRTAERARGTGAERL